MRCFSYRVAHLIRLCFVCVYLFSKYSFTAQLHSEILIYTELRVSNVGLFLMQLTMDPPVK